jgi:hypothetical protein
VKVQGARDFELWSPAMSVLHVEDVPDDLYQRIEELATADGLSVGEQTVQLLQRAVGEAQTAGPVDVRAILAEFRLKAIVPCVGTPDSVDLLREDRGR